MSKPKAKPTTKPAKGGKPSKGPSSSSGGGFLRRWARRLAILAGLAYAGLAAFGWFASDALIFPAPRPSYPATEPDLAMIPVPGGGSVAALWLPAKNAPRAILYLHGNGEDIGRIRRRLELIREYTGCSVLAPDYPGYGLSPGVPSEPATLRAAEAAFGHLSLIRGYRPADIVLWGYSLGTGPAVALAATRPVRAVILDAPFTSTFRTVVPWKVLPFDRFDNLARIDRVQSPLLIAHGDLDRRIPFAHGEALHRAATAAPVNRFLRLAGCGHTDIPGEHGPEYRREVRRLIDGIAPAGE